MILGFANLMKFAGHVVFEMAAGYELTHLRPREDEYMNVDKKVTTVLKYIFEEGFPHDIDQVSCSAVLDKSSETDSEFARKIVYLVC